MVEMRMGMQSRDPSISLLYYCFPDVISVFDISQIENFQFVSVDTSAMH